MQQQWLSSENKGSITDHQILSQMTIGISKKVSMHSPFIWGLEICSRIHMKYTWRLCGGAVTWGWRASTDTSKSQAMEGSWDCEAFAFFILVGWCPSSITLSSFHLRWFQHGKLHTLTTTLDATRIVKRMNFVYLYLLIVRSTTYLGNCRDLKLSFSLLLIGRSSTYSESCKGLLSTLVIDIT